MATNNSIDSNIPIEISLGGTNASMMTLPFGALYYDGSNVVTVSSLGASSQVLLSNGPGVAPSFQTFAGDGFPDPAFVAFRNSQFLGTGQGAPLTILFNQGVYTIGSHYSGITGNFVAPSTNKYCLLSELVMIRPLSSTSYTITIVTSNRDYTVVGNFNSENNSSSEMQRVIETLADMDAGDTASVVLTTWGASSSDQTGVTKGFTTTFSGFTLGT